MILWPQENIINWQKIKSNFWAIILLIGLLAVSLPLLFSGMFRVHDYTHGARIAEMTRALKDGHFPVRWSQNFGFGYGMPLFQFYGPLPFYIGGIIYWITNRLILSVKALFILSNALTLLGAFFLGKRLFKSSWAASFVALAITLAPYRILNLYVRGAVNELWGIMALPWILLTLFKTVKKERYGLIGLSLSLTVLFLSHNITTLIFTPFFLLTVLVFLLHDWLCSTNAKELKLKELFRTTWRVVGSGLLGVGLSAFYLLPAYLEKKFTQVEKHILAEYFNFRLHFLYLRQFFRANWGFGGSQWGPDDPISFFLGFGQIIALVTFFALVGVIIYTTIHKREKKIKSTLLSLFLPVSFALLLVFSLAMTSEKSLILWESLPILEFVQFPWRFLAVSLVYLALIGGWVVLQLEYNHAKKTSMVRNSHLLFGAILFFLVLLNAIFVQPEDYLDQPSSIYSSEPNQVSSRMSEILPDYIPTQLTLENPPQNLLVYDDLFSEGKAEILVNRTHEKLIEVDIHEPTKITLNLADYPGWQSYLGLEKVAHQTTQEGLVAVDLPQGEQLLAMRFEGTSIRTLSDLVSLVSWVALLSLVYAQSLDQSKKQVIIT